MGRGADTQDLFAYEKSVICRCETMYDAPFENSKRGLHVLGRQEIEA